MRARVVIGCIVGALILSAGFIVSGLFTYAWATDMPKSFAHEVIRAFYMPQALSGALVLDVIERDRDASPVMAYGLWFLATLPASLIYVLIAIGSLKLIRRLQPTKGAGGET
jgi:hypothetical protein